jgi:hypothetical protein
VPRRAVTLLVAVLAAAALSATALAALLGKGAVRMHRPAFTVVMFLAAALAVMSTAGAANPGEPIDRR